MIIFIYDNSCHSNFLLHSVPGYLLYKGIYDLFHKQAIWATRASSHGYQGIWLSIDTYTSFVLAFIVLLFGTFQVGQYLANKDRKKGEKARIPTLKQYIISFLIELGISLLFVPVMMLVNSTINPW
ncbi:MAG: hypothetical protein M1142_04290 [Patescibacteria group bacterium]|nr:hypothetical protein [Patescibacteria group bacterium]